MEHAGENGELLNIGEVIKAYGDHEVLASNLFLSKSMYSGSKQEEQQSCFSNYFWRFS